MKYIALVLTVFGILGVVAAQISLPIQPPAYYGAPSTPKKHMLRRRDTRPYTRKPHAFNVANVEKPEPAGAKSL
ncbi:hypothetical protein ColLi_05668 [Colletotrichum liriopes]|uniref:Uncharacterized protein n=1 Tax=Colletotrichum liriopes TaxID=708192 RepID=A0AA37GLJ0_9PEZI|nr:hypothetical protein ColLi_05668 [Colletotrichum liriopes]